MTAYYMRDCSCTMPLTALSGSPYNHQGFIVTPVCMPSTPLCMPSTNGMDVQGCRCMVSVLDHERLAADQSEVATCGRIRMAGKVPERSTIRHIRRAGEHDQGNSQ